MRDEDTLILEQLYMESNQENLVEQTARKHGYNIGPVYHQGTFNVEEGDTVFIIEESGIHFGTKYAAIARIGGKIADDFFKELKTYEDEDGWYWESGVDEMGPFDTEEEALKNAQAAGDSLAENVDDYGSITKVYLKCDKPISLRDNGQWPDDLKQRIKAKGGDSVEYINNFEDKGSKSYIVFEPTQIKLADPVTYDDEGNEIPLNKRFDTTNPDIRY